MEIPGTQLKLPVLTRVIAYIPNIYPAELQLKKANTSENETSFLDLNINI